MFKLRYGYLISGIITGSLLLATFVGSLPDGQLHVIFCAVGQGDAAYIKFPDGRDMLVDGGPDTRVIGCLGRHMPFWDRNLDLVVMSHPQRDHIAGLIPVFERYGVGYFVRTPTEEQSDVYEQLVRLVKKTHTLVKFAAAGEKITIGPTILSVMSPEEGIRDVNASSLVFILRYGAFDALFTGDATLGSGLVVGTVELLKVPHHGSKTGLVQAAVEALHPAIAVISVGRNSFGHPSQEVLSMLAGVGAAIHRTDKEGDIEVISDGKSWKINTKSLQR